MVDVSGYLEHFAQAKEKTSAAREPMRQRLLTDPVAHAVMHIVALAREAAPGSDALLDATVALMEIFDGQRQSP